MKYVIQGKLYCLTFKVLVKTFLTSKLIRASVGQDGEDEGWLVTHIKPFNVYSRQLRAFQMC